MLICRKYDENEVLSKQTISEQSKVNKLAKKKKKKKTLWKTCDSQL